MSKNKDVPPDDGIPRSPKTGKMVRGQYPHSFKPGKSPNPGGRKPWPTEVRRRMYEAGPKAIDTLISLLDDEDHRIAFQASVEIATRCYGKNAAGELVRAPEDTAARLRQLEDALHDRAIKGDTSALLAALRAIDPARYGPNATADADAAKPTRRFVLVDVDAT